MWHFLLCLVSRLSQHRPQASVLSVQRHLSPSSGACSYPPLLSGGQWRHLDSTRVLVQPLCPISSSQPEARGGEPLLRSLVIQTVQGLRTGQGLCICQMDLHTGFPHSDAWTPFVKMEGSIRRKLDQLVLELMWRGACKFSVPSNLASK